MVFTVFLQWRYLFRDINGKVQGTRSMNMRILTPPIALAFSAIINKSSLFFVTFTLRCRSFIITHNARAEVGAQSFYVLYIPPSSRFIRYNKQRLPASQNGRSVSAPCRCRAWLTSPFVSQHGCRLCHLLSNAMQAAHASVAALASV
jgi:hypothetical protein